MNLTDSFVIDGVRRTSDGYLSASAKVARTGIQVYRGHELGRPDLETVRVYRPPEEVFHADALRSFAHRPLTLRHPSVPVTAKNWKKFAGGQTGDEVVRDGEYVRVPMVMMDQALIDAYEKDGIKELSMGYSTDIQWRTGVTDAGEQYDAVQTAIRGNHLAVVPQARGGDQLRLEDDKDEHGYGSYPRSHHEDFDRKKPPKDTKEWENWAEEMKARGYKPFGAPDSNDPEERAARGLRAKDSDDNTNNGEYTMKLVIDGLTVNVADDQSGGIIERHIASLVKQVATVTDSFEDFKKKAKDKDDEMDKSKKACDAKDGEIAVLKKQIEDAKITPEKLDVLVKDRMAVVDKAKTLLGDKYVFDGKTVEDIRKDAVGTAIGDAAKTMNDDAVAGAFAALTKDAKTNSAQQIGDALRSRPHSAGSVTLDARDAAYADNIKHLEGNWKTPSAA